MNSHRIQERSDCVIEDRRFLRLVDVLDAQEVDKVARIHAVQSIEQHIEAILQMNQLALLEVHRVKRPRRQVVEYLKQIWKKGANRCGDDGEQGDDAQQARHEDCHISFNLKCTFDQKLNSLEC